MTVLQPELAGYGSLPPRKTQPANQPRQSGRRRAGRDQIKLVFTSFNSSVVSKQVIGQLEVEQSALVVGDPEIVA